MSGGPRRLGRGLCCLALVGLVLAVFGQVAGHPFLDYDDGEYVYANPVVLSGLSWEGARWALVTNHAANWHPLTWLSHMADVTLFGTAAGAHHLVNVLLHAATAVLLFLVLDRSTGEPPPSALAAMLFAVHPLHVESVAWVAERKDVLCGLLWVLTVAVYARYARRPSARRWLAVAGALFLALLAKPMAVTLPFVLLLLDAWPLRRLHRGARTLVLEKVPLLLLAAVAAALTWRAQSASGATAGAEAYPFRDRLLNACLAYAVYLRQTVWPAHLSVFYPHPCSVGASVDGRAALGALVLLAALTAAAVWQRRRGYPLVGWLWFAGTLVPVIGLVQVGAQAHADRYTYLPLVGLFVALAWGLWDAVGRRWPPFAAVSIPLALVLAGTAWLQTGHWRDRATLYAHAIASTGQNWLAWNNLGLARLDDGDLAGAEHAFAVAVQAKPDYADGWYNAGVAELRGGQLLPAVHAYRQALALDAANPDAWVNLGIAYRGLRREAEALACFDRALALRSDDPLALGQRAPAARVRGSPGG